MPASDKTILENLVNSTIRRALGPTIILGSGTYFDYENPEVSEITLEDVAYGLAFEGRFAGQCVSRKTRKRVMYSSGQHSVISSYAIDPQYALPMLWHESGEAPCGDMTGPLKSLNPVYKSIEKRCEKAINNKFSIPVGDAVVMKKVDVRLLVTERRDLINWEGEKWSADDQHEPYDFEIVPWSLDDAAQAFIDRHRELAEGARPTKLLLKLMQPMGFYSQSGGVLKWSPIELFRRR